MENTIPDPSAEPPRRRFDWLHVLLFILLALVVAVGATLWVLRAQVFPSPFSPVTLDAKETAVLNAKLDSLDTYQDGRLAEAIGRAGQQPATVSPEPPELPSTRPLQPERYSEVGASREISFTERELNALLARNTDLATKLAVDLSGDLMSVRYLMPVEDDFPVLAGKVVKLRAGVEFAYRDGKPIVMLKGISVMGVPVPNAWLGGMKNVDLVQEFGNRDGFWKAFAEGVEYIRVEEGKLKIVLRE